jgi:large subunit ribosomal protein L23
MSVLKKPVVTEKYLELAKKRNQYGFICTKKATKDEIKAEVEKVYEVEVVRVNTMIYPGKSKSRFTKKGFVEGRTIAYKKAVVTLKEGQTIDFYGNAPEEENN